MTQKLENRIALITGASRGLGAAIAQAYAKEGAQVILLARNVKALEEVDDRIQAAGGKATLMPFDLLQTDKIEAIGPTIAERFGKLDIFVGNAAMLGALSPVSHTDPKTQDKVFNVNYFANVQMIRTLDPLLRGSDAGRAIFVTSGAATAHTPYWSTYAASKAALECMAATYAAEVAFSPLKVNIVDPGILRTGLRAEAFPGEDPLELPEPADITQRFIDLAAPDCTETGQIVKAA
ncbi:MAG: SDR family NAD(P)-dependent oxidoreductase [Alphaproteobacteria bacterium]|nr:SDR family NAD(P)-dependent oxidoreductase [Alphaproteobacteria bacterium]